ncbi:hypothetical protein SLS62_010755 [Diatrype stigma]|uniref:BZIP transcription factor n=1 Tax=Diatrype stigma TaxID=117547 RepID=A0AAN9YHA6_9PEZI
MVPSSTAPSYSTSSFSTHVVPPPVSPPAAAPSRPSDPAASPSSLSVPPSGSGVSGGLSPPVAASGAADPRKHEYLLSHDVGLSPASSASPPATGHHHTGLAGSSATAAEDHRSKRRKYGPSSRGVANLTPEQLAKKRANDREAQRAVRERTKNQIEQLETRIRELTSLDPYQELQAVMRAKEAVEAENAEIKSRLASIMALVQPVLSGYQGGRAREATLAPPTAHKTIPIHPAPPAPPSLSPANHDSPAPSTASPTSVDTPPYCPAPGRLPNAAPQPSLSPKLGQVKVVGQRRQDLLHNLDLGAGEQLQLNFLLDPSQRVNKFQNGLHENYDPHSIHHLPLKRDWSSTSYPQHPDVSIEQNLLARSESWVTYSAPINHSAATCTLDGLLLAFIRERRQRAAEGIPTQEIVGPRYPSVSSLLNPATSAYVHPMSKVFADILATFPGLCTLPEKVAVLYFMFLNMRWWINPSQETFDLLPAWARPVPAQLSLPHPPWIDHVPFPEMRAKLAREYNNSEYLFDDFFIPYTSTLSVNWPYEPEDALLQSSDHGGELLINPVFERHMRRLENWTLGASFDKAFPQLRGTYNLEASAAEAGPAADTTMTTTTTTTATTTSNSATNSGGGSGGGGNPNTANTAGTNNTQL